VWIQNFRDDPLLQQIGIGIVVMIQASKVSQIPPSMVLCVECLEWVVERTRDHKCLICNPANEKQYKSRPGVCVSNIQSAHRKSVHDSLASRGWAVTVGSSVLKVRMKSGKEKAVFWSSVCMRIPKEELVNLANFCADLLSEGRSMDEAVVMTRKEHKRRAGF